MKIRRSLRGNVDRNKALSLEYRWAAGRSLRGNVDRNTPLKQFPKRGKMSFPTWERG